MSREILRVSVALLPLWGLVALGCGGQAAAIDEAEGGEKSGWRVVRVSGDAFESLYVVTDSRTGCEYLLANHFEAVALEFVRGSCSDAEVRKLPPMSEWP